MRSSVPRQTWGSSFESPCSTTLTTECGLGPDISSPLTFRCINHEHHPELHRRSSVARCRSPEVHRIEAVESGPVLEHRPSPFTTGPTPPSHALCRRPPSRNDASPGLRRAVTATAASYVWPAPHHLENKSSVSKPQTRERRPGLDHDAEQCLPPPSSTSSPVPRASAHRPRTARRVPPATTPPTSAGSNAQPPGWRRSAYAGETASARRPPARHWPASPRRSPGWTLATAKPAFVVRLRIFVRPRLQDPHSIG